MRDLGLRFVRHNLFWPTLALVLLLLLNLSLVIYALRAPAD